MKKLFSSFLLFNMLFFNCSFVCAIEDNLVELLDKNLKIQKAKQEPIIDDFVLKTLEPNLKIKKQNKIIITDNLVNNLDKNLKIQKEIQRPVVDNLVFNLDKNSTKPLNKAEVNVKYDGDKIKVAPLKYYTTRKDLFEGKIIDFILVQDTKINNKLYKKGTTIKARVETLSQNGAYGVPADLVVGNFTLPDNLTLHGDITKQGANRSLWVYPTGYILTPFFLIGLLIFPIRGGHVKLKPEKVYDIEI